MQVAPRMRAKNIIRGQYYSEIFMPKTNHLSRRDFIKDVTALIGGMISLFLGLPVIGYLLAPAMRKEENSDVIDLGPLENYTVGIPTPFGMTHTQINGWERTATLIGMYVLRIDSGRVQVLSNICTHLACQVNWDSDDQEYKCPCHDGFYDINGFVISGPPPRPLDEFKIKIEDGNLYVITPAIQRSA